MAGAHRPAMQNQLCAPSILAPLLQLPVARSMRKTPLSVLFLIRITLCAQTGNAPTPNAQQIHDSAIVIDTNADTPQFMLDMHYDLGTPSDTIHVNLDKAKRGNLSA